MLTVRRQRIFPLSWGHWLPLPLRLLETSSFADYLWLILYGVVNVGVGFGVYLIGVKRVSALVAALVGLSEIPLAPIWAWLLFNERMNLAVLFGGSVILTAAVIYITSSGKRDRTGDEIIGFGSCSYILCYRPTNV